MTPPLRIAQIAPLHERVPPRLYGGTERVVSFLTEELVRQGHDVTLFASGNSKTSANLVHCCDMALRLNPSVRDTLPYHMIMLDEVRRRIDQFDVLHFHIDVLHGPLVRDIADRTLTTLHWRPARAACKTSSPSPACKRVGRSTHIKISNSFPARASDTGDMSRRRWTSKPSCTAVPILSGKTTNKPSQLPGYSILSLKAALELQCDCGQPSARPVVGSTGSPAI